MSQDRLLFKLIIIGSAKVGKTAFLHRYGSDKFITEYKATIGADFIAKEITIRDRLCKLQFWDTAGQERFKSLGSAFYRGSDGCILMYDITNRQSFDVLDKLRDEFLDKMDEESKEYFPFLLIGNKNDDENNRTVSKEEGLNYAKKNNMTFYEISTKNSSEEVKKVVRHLSEIMFDEKLDSMPVKNESVKIAQRRLPGEYQKTQEFNTVSNGQKLLMVVGTIAIVCLLYYKFGRKKM